MSVDLGSTVLDAPVLAGAEGVEQPSQPGGIGGFLSDVIVDLGFADRDVVESAVNEARQAGKAVVALLLEREQLTTEQLARAIAERNGLPFVDLERFQADETARQLVDRRAALRYRAVPIAIADDGALIVALADPLDALAVSDIAVMTKSDLIPVVADSAQIEALVETMPKHRPAGDFLTPSGADPAASGPAPSASLAALSLVRPAPQEQPPAAAPASGTVAPGLERRIVELVQAAVQGAAASEVERLEREVEDLRTELATSKREIERLSGGSPPGLA